MRIGYGGMLRPDKEEETKGKKDGNGNGNGMASNGNAFWYKWWIQRRRYLTN